MFSKLTFAATAALLLIAPVLADSSNCTRTYTVVSGDICDGISRAQNVSTYQLAAVNSNTVDALCSNLQVGQQLCLGTPGEDCTSVHIVEDADTCSTIQSTFGLNSTILMQNNPNIDAGCDNLYNGLALCIADTVMAPPIPAGFFNSNSTGTVDWVPVSPGDVGDNEDLPYCDEVDDGSS
jgi:LysM repeat protein